MLFQYTQLSSPTIRLVNILPYSTPGNIFLSLEHTSPTAPYEVLIHPPSTIQDRKPVTLSGRAFMVPAPIWDALNAMLKSPRRGYKLWIPEICVNQRDEDEKAEQNRRFSEVLQSAEEVLLWAEENGDFLAKFREDPREAMQDAGLPDDVFSCSASLKAFCGTGELVLLSSEVIQRSKV